MSLSVTKIINISQDALKFLVNNDSEEETPNDCKSAARVFGNKSYAWQAKGPHLQIINSKTGHLVGSWTFGRVLKDPKAKVICVEELHIIKNQLPLLVVALEYEFTGGMICIFDFTTSRVIRAVQILGKITSLHVIDSCIDVLTLATPLQSFDGIISIGLAGGDVLLVDLCRQLCREASSVNGFNDIRDEENPCLLITIPSEDLNHSQRILSYKESSVRNNEHLALYLNHDISSSEQHFTLKGPKGEARLNVNKEEVTVSALHFCPQLCSLLVGYNFGALQLYNLMDLKLIYTSPVCNEHIPITYFSIQEPADDPRPVCYIWAIYSSDEVSPRSLPLAVMYAFSYQSKECDELYGSLYQNFVNASVQYQMELGVPYGHTSSKKPRGGNCLKLNSIHRGALNKDSFHQESNEDNCTLSIFVWNIFYNNLEIETFLAIFDLNQWYKEQMPNRLNARYNTTYMVHILLNELINTASNKCSQILDVYFDENTIKQFKSAQKLEEHYYPNSLTFGLTCFRETDLVLLKNHGVQKALLALIESSGPLCLIEPSEIYQEIVKTGLVPLFIELPVNIPISTNQQRDIILSTALENHFMGWLCKCASEWAHGGYRANGCSLDSLICWAFQRANTLKTNCDIFCKSLFDYSGHRLDNNTNTLLTSCMKQLNYISSLYAFIMGKYLIFISNKELVHTQFMSLETVTVYFQVLQWLLNVGLLPECPLSSYPRPDDVERISAPYPVEMLCNFYNQRRGSLKIMHEENFGSSESIIFIDSLIENECVGTSLQKEWLNDGGNGFYPPPSLQSLLRIYLIENVDLSTKHTILMYLFLDLAMTLDQERYQQVIMYLIKFPTVFKVKFSVIRLAQAFWQLDHCDFNSAIGLLLDPLIPTQDLTHWQHRLVLRSLISQKQHKFALLYLEVRQPILKDNDDLLSVVSLYIANNMLDEAFYFEKNFITENTINKVLGHFIYELKKFGKIGSLIYRSLSESEEKFFLQHLRSGKQSTDEDLFVYYHILRSRFLEAFDSYGVKVLDQKGIFGQENSIPRDKLIHSFKELLPDMGRKLISFCQKEKSHKWQKVPRPTPLSVFINNASENVQYKSTLIGAALSKAKQTFNDVTLSENRKTDTEEIPFLRTPIIPTGSKRRSSILINPKVIDVSVDDSCSTPPSAKRPKLSPKTLDTSISSPIPSKFDTPLVKRMVERTGSEIQNVNVTPHSILKVKSFSGSIKEDDFEKEFSKLVYTPKKSALGLSPRKSLGVVRFEGINSANSSKESSKLSISPCINTTSRLSESSKNTSTEDEVFYSPEASLEESKTDEVEKVEASPKIDVVETIEESVSTSPMHSPKSRRGLRTQLRPVRSSPRLSRSTNDTPVASPVKLFGESAPNKEVEETEEKTLESSESPTGSPVIPKLQSRKSLCRQVLETNAMNRVLESPRTRRMSRRFEPIETRSVENTEEVILESKLQFEDGEKIQESVQITKHNLTTSVVELDSSSDFSFQYDNKDDVPLSDSMRRYLNTTTRNSLAATTKRQSILGQSRNSTIQPEKSEANVSENIETVSPETTSKEMRDGNESRSFALSAFESSTEGISMYEASGPNLSESILRCINDDASVVQNEKVEVMEIDDDDNNEEETDVQKEENKSETAKLETEIVEPGNSISDNSKAQSAIAVLEKLSDDDRTADPEMNVFEMTDDLSFTNETSFKEVTFGENDLCYGQQNTLENVLEENIVTNYSSTPLTELEENVFNDSDASEEPDQEEEDNIETDNSDKSSFEDIQHKEEEIIEIVSSSDQESASKSPDSSISVESNKGVRVKNIFESDGDTASDEVDNEDNERHYSEISENSQDSLAQNIGLFRSAYHDKDSSKSDADYENENSTEERRINNDSKESESEKDEIEEKDLIEEPQIEEASIDANDDAKLEEEHKSQESSGTLEQTEENIEIMEVADEDNVDLNDEVVQEKLNNTNVLQEKNSEDSISIPAKSSDETTKEENDEEPATRHDEDSIEMEALNYSADEEKDIEVQNDKSLETETTKEDLDILLQTPKRLPADILEQFQPEPVLAKTAKTRSRRVKSLSDQPTEIDFISAEPPLRSLRTRAVSTEEKTVPVRRIRSQSVEGTIENTKPRGKRAASVAANLPKIQEESNALGLEEYTMARRLTRKQKSLMKAAEGIGSNLQQLDPIILLDKISFAGEPDPEEQKIYNKSPSLASTSSTSPGEIKTRLRSASVSSEVSLQSKSKEPVTSGKRRGRKGSKSEEVSPVKGKTKLEDIAEEVKEKDKPKEAEPTTSTHPKRKLKNATQEVKDLGKPNKEATIEGNEKTAKLRSRRNSKQEEEEEDKTTTTKAKGNKKLEVINENTEKLPQLRTTRSHSKEIHKPEDVKSQTKEVSTEEEPKKTRTRSRRNSKEEEPPSTPKLSSKTKLEVLPEEGSEESPLPRATRSRAKSVSSVSSEESHSSQKSKSIRRRIPASKLQQIAEEASEADTIPKKRTRKNSTQK